MMPDKKAEHSATAAALAARLQEGLLSHQGGRLDEAEAAYREILVASPRHFDATQLLATLHGQRGQTAEAVRLFKLALAINPASINVLNNLSAVLTSQGRHAEAAEILKRAVKAAPNAPGTYNNLGVVQMHLGRTVEAVEAFDRAVSLKPDFVDALANRAAALCAAQRYDDAAASAEAALRHAPLHASALANLGLARLHQEQLQEALAHLEGSLRLNPRDADAWNNYGQVLTALKRDEEALASFRRAINLAPEHADALAGCAVTLFRMSDAPQALEYIKKSLRLKPGNIEALRTSGYVQVTLELHEQGLEDFERALALDRARFHPKTGVIGRLAGDKHCIIVMEPGFSTRAGHYQRGVVGLGTLVAPLKVACFAGLRVDTGKLPDNVRVEPVFPLSINSHLPGAFRTEGRYLDAGIEHVLRGARAQDHIVVPSGDIGMVNALTRVLAKHAPERTPQIHLRFFMVDRGIMPLDGAADAVNRLLATRTGARRVQILTELPEQADYVREAWNVAAECVPYIQPALFTADPSATIEREMDKLSIGFFGASRGEKGLEFIPSIIDSFLELAPDLDGRTRWIVQASGTGDWAENALAPVIAYSDAHPGLIDLHTGSLQSDAYDDLFAQADIIALPYKADLYRMRSSGVAAEATFAAKPFVYSAGSSLGAFGGESALDADTPESFAAALVRICREFPAFAAKAVDAREALRARIFQSAFLDRISKPAGRI